MWDPETREPQVPRAGSPPSPGAMLREVLDELLLELWVHSRAEQTDAGIAAQVGVERECATCRRGTRTGGERNATLALYSCIKGHRRKRNSRRRKEVQAP